MSGSWVRRWRWLIGLRWLCCLVVLLLVRRGWLVVVWVLRLLVLWLLVLWLLVLWLLVATIPILVLSLVPPSLMMAFLGLLVLIALWSMCLCRGLRLWLSISSTQAGVRLDHIAELLRVCQSNYDY